MWKNDEKCLQAFSQQQVFKNTSASLFLIRFAWYYIYIFFIFFLKLLSRNAGMQQSSPNPGPLLGLLGFLLMPAVWSVPEALVAAELATTFPSNGGYVTWVTAPGTWGLARSC